MTYKTPPVLATLFFGVAIAGLLAAAEVAVTDRTAAADEVVASRTASVMSSPGEQSRQITRVRAGQKLFVLDKKGRWIKVRVNGRTGWITRSNVVDRQARESSPSSEKRRRPFVEGRSRKRGRRAPAPTDRVGADATDEGFIDEDEFEDDRVSSRERRDDDDFEDEEFEDEEFEDEEFEDEEFEDEEESEEPTVKASSEVEILSRPNKKGKAVALAEKGQRLYVIDRDGKWMKVETDGGDAGWVRNTDVSGDAYQYQKWDKKGRVGLGYQSLSQSFTSDGMGDLAAYDISSGSLVLGLGGELIHDYSEDYLLAAELGYNYVHSSPGIRVQVGDDVSDVGYKVHEINARGGVGYKLSEESGLAGYARLGYHYSRFGVDNVEDFETNIARIPSEILAGFTVGLMFDMPQFSDKLAFRAGLDMLLTGSRTQTVGLEDGAVSDASALWGIFRADYQWKATTKLTATYQYYQAATSWTGAAEESMRPQASTAAERGDKSHTVVIGAGRAF